MAPHPPRNQSLQDHRGGPYHLLLRRSVSPTLRELGLNWQQMAQDGSCEVWGLTAPMLACLGRPARRLGEIHACQVE